MSVDLRLGAAVVEAIDLLTMEMIEKEHVAAIDPSPGRKGQPGSFVIVIPVHCPSEDDDDHHSVITIDLPEDVAHVFTDCIKSLVDEANDHRRGAVANVSALDRHRDVEASG